MTQDFFLIGGQSNVGTNEKPPSEHYGLGAVAYSQIPLELTGTQLNVKVWDGVGFIDFAPKLNKGYGWINHLLKSIGQTEKVISFYKYGKGGTQLIQTGHALVYPRYFLEYNGLLAWNHFKANNPNPRLIFLWCQGFSDGTELQNSLDYGAHETTNRNHNSGGELGEWFNRIRRLFREPDMPVIFNTLANGATRSAYRANIKLGQLHVASLSSNNIFVDADDTDMPDGAHQSASGVIDLANRYLTAYNTI